MNLLLLNNFYPVMSYRRVSKRKQRIIVYIGSVTRYGPQSAQAVKEDSKYLLIDSLSILD